MKIIFMGTPEFAVPVLETLIKEKFEIVMVVTQPDRIQGRKKEIIYSPIKKIALKHNLPVFQPYKIKQELEELFKVEADLVVTAAFGQILPKALLDHWPAINVHGSLLPKYRGGAPIQYALFNGDAKTGVTIMDMALKMDSGDIILKEEVPITPNDNYETLSNKMSLVGAKLLVEVLRNNLPRIKQNENDVTFAFTLKREDEYLDFYEEKWQINHHLQGLLPEPAATIKINADEYKVYKIEKSDIIKEMNPGEILIENKRMFIKAVSGIYEILEIQAAGKRRMDIKDFLNGQKNIVSGDYVAKKEGI